MLFDSILPTVSKLVQSLSRVRLFATPWTAARQASLSSTNSLSLLKLMSIESVMPSIGNSYICHYIYCHKEKLGSSVGGVGVGRGAYMVKSSQIGSPSP